MLSIKLILYFQILPFFFGTNGYIDIPESEPPFLFPLIIEKYLLRQHKKLGTRSQKSIARGFITNSIKGYNNYYWGPRSDI